METTAFDILIVPTIWVTFGGIVVGSVLHLLMQGVENAIRHLSSARDERESFLSTARDFLARRARPAGRGAMRLHR
jgi:hypothetical protein